MGGSVCRRYPWLVAGTGVYLGFRLWSFVGIAGHASSFTDSPEYENVERLSMFSLDFWTWYKPWGSALLWKVLPGSTSTSAPVGQEIVSVAAWLFLAFVVFRTLERRAVKYVGFSLVLAFSLVPAVAVWDGALLESLSVSLERCSSERCCSLHSPRRGPARRPYSWPRFCSPAHDQPTAT